MGIQLPYSLPSLRIQNQLLQGSLVSLASATTGEKVSVTKEEPALSEEEISSVKKSLKERRERREGSEGSTRSEGSSGSVATRIVIGELRSNTIKSTDTKK